MATVPLIRVLIATTRGPVEVQNIARENPAVRSVICVGGSFTALPVSPAYDAFVREPTGVVERMTGHPVYRTDVTAPIEAGESWQLGMFLAHAFHLFGALAKPGDVAAQTILVTGGLDRNLKVTPVSHVAEKLARAGAPDQGAGIFLHPHGTEAIADTDGWKSVPVTGARDALEICLGRQEAERLLPQPPEWKRKTSGHSKLRAFTVAIGGLCILLLATLAGLALWPAALGECGSPVPIPPDVEVFKGAACFGRMSVAERGEYRIRMAVTGAFSSYVDQNRYRRELQRVTDGGDRLVLQIDFPYWVREPVRLEAEADLLAMDGQPVRSARRSLEVIPAGTSDY